MDAVQVEKAVKALGDKPTLNNFIEQFGVFSQGPEGIESFRLLVLELAFSGKLCENQKKSSDSLFDEISLIKQNLIKNKTLKKTKSQGGIIPDEVRLNVPETWRWVRLGDVFDVRDGTHDSPKYYDSGYPLVTSKNIYAGKLDLTNVKYISEEDHKKISERSRVDREDILFAMIGSIGNPVIVDVEPDFSVKNVGLFKYYDRELSNPTFLLNYLKLAEVWFKEESSGAVQSFVSLGKLRSYPFPLAPIEEQKRIVAKVDELMALCDQLEAQQQQQANTLLKSNTAAIHALLSADTSHATKQKADSQNPQNKKQANFKTAWERIANNFHTLYGNTLPMPPGEGRQKKYFVGLENVKRLRQAIIQLAIFGKLLPQNILESVERLMREIKSEKSKYIRKNVAHIDDTSSLPAIPRNWEWVTLDQLSQDIHYGYTASANHEITEVRLLRITDIQNDKVDWVSVPGCEIEDKKLSKNKLYEGDLLIARTGGTIGKTYLVNNLTVNAVFASYLIRFKPLKAIWPEYIKLYTLSKIYWDQLVDNTSGSAQPNVNATSLKSMAIPFPPMEEQKRIVDKVDQLMSICDQLEQQLTTAYDDAEKLINATIRSLVA